MGGLGIKSWYNSELSLHKLPTLDKSLEDFGIFPKEVDHASVSTDETDRSPTPTTAADDTIGLTALHVDDDPTLSPYTVRMVLLGLGLSTFGAALATIFLFKPQSVSVSVIFLTVISYVLGNGMAAVLPSKGKIGRWLNPHGFNSKEHLTVIIMSSSASSAAYATEVLATQKLYYGVVPPAAVAILLLFSSQLLGYGMAGVLRRSLVYPTKMVWPGVLPLSSLVQTLHQGKASDGGGDGGDTARRFKFFWVVFGVVAVWELFPQYIMPALTGVSVFCLANRNSLVFTNVFGGSSGNEGLGLLALSFDWQYITTSAFFLPFVTLANGFAGYVLCMALFLGLYYGNVWQALQFPFLSQQLFSPSSSADKFVVYNQSAILDAEFVLNTTALAVEGLPFFAASNASYLLTTNLGVTATVVHMCLWHADSVRAAFAWNWKGMWVRLRQPRTWWKRTPGAAASGAAVDTETDPHYLKMKAYAEVPAWWYLSVLVVSAIVGLGCVYGVRSTLPWWGFLIATTLSFLATLFFGALSGLIGFNVPISSLIQLLGGYLHPGRPVANMYFVLFGSNAHAQALSLVGNLKLGQYGKLSPRCTFAVTLAGTLLGAVVNFVLMNAITTSQRDILLSIQGTNVWSGQVIQSFNSNAIAFGALSQDLFGWGRTYQWILLALPLGLVLPLPFYLLHRRFPRAGIDSVITPVLCWYLGYLSVGINSSVLVYFVLGFVVQLHVRRRYAAWFVRYNYLLAAAISGGTELLVFVTTFAVQGGSGTPVPFPPYWGNNFQTGNFDFCALNPALG